MKKINNFFFGVDHVAVSEMIFFYGITVLIITMSVFFLIGAASL